MREQGPGSWNHDKFMNDSYVGSFDDSLKSYEPPQRRPQKRMGWFHDRMTWPMLAGVALLFLTSCGAQFATQTVHGCSATGERLVQMGEVAFARDDLQAAQDLGDDALTTENCRPAHLLLAKVSQARFKAARTKDIDKAGSWRRQCYQHASMATLSFWYETPEVRALKMACAAGSLQTAGPENPAGAGGGGGGLGEP